ncbi:MAG: hypothetical protein WBN88_13645 [Anderseniella sp.]
MKITRVRATPINVPLEAAYVWSYGTLPGFTQTIIEVETEEGPFRPKNNVVRAPEGPGPGVTLSRDKLKFLHQRFLDNGVMNKYYNPADPGRFVRLPLV